MNSQLIHGDSFEVLKSFPDNSFDAIITDPPYGINLDKWDSGIDVKTFTEEVYRLLDNGFYAFFGQMPTIVEWLNQCQKNKMLYRDQIVWIKRITIPNYNLSRTFENIYIYTKQRKKYYSTSGLYEDIEIPSLLTGCISVDGLDRYIKSLWNRIETGNNQDIGETKVKHHIYNRLRFAGNRSPREANFTNVWSFLPPNNKQKNGIANKFHPTQKPLELMKRLVELTTPKNGIVLDPFCGSGTTALACLETGRKYVVIEKEQGYYEIAKQRINDWHKENKQLELDVI